MKFSKNIPSKEGFYWYRCSPEHEPRVRELVFDPDDESLSVYEGHGEFNFIENYEGEWAGPLVPPNL